MRKEGSVTEKGQEVERGQGAEGIEVQKRIGTGGLEAEKDIVEIVKKKAAGAKVKTVTMNAAEKANHRGGANHQRNAKVEHLLPQESQN